ncbi:hypothetical protein [Ottowia cancrivicina]|uniref:hypothetical protein n=1 Tax=Ottowia cancrivicina TaxID=3040346 RepID=UPI0024437049|nr:hypothetical protein [Ottowia sp. 10c7w1]
MLPPITARQLDRQKQRRSFGVTKKKVSGHREMDRHFNRERMGRSPQKVEYQSLAIYQYSASRVERRDLFRRF